MASTNEEGKWRVNILLTEELFNCHVCAFHWQGSLSLLLGFAEYSRRHQEIHHLGMVRGLWQHIQQWDLNIPRAYISNVTKNLYLQCNTGDPAVPERPRGRAERALDLSRQPRLISGTQFPHPWKLCVFCVMVIGLNLSWPSSSPFNNQKDSMYMIKLFSVFTIKL